LVNAVQVRPCPRVVVLRYPFAEDQRFRFADLILRRYPVAKLAT